MKEEGSAQAAYDRFAAAYDVTNAQNNYELWLGKVLLPELEGRGLQKGWALDVGCGTGQAFDPLLERGWKIVGCDVSAEMVAEARRKYPSIALHHLDGRALPPLGPQPDSPKHAFQLVLLLNDVINYMTEESDLTRAFAGVAENLDPANGLLVFDINTISLLRNSFQAGASEAMSERGVEWQGLSNTIEAEGTFEARLSGHGIEPHIHRQRHWTPRQVTDALAVSGLSCLALLGQREEGTEIALSEEPDEERDSKIIVIASHGT